MTNVNHKPLNVNLLVKCRQNNPLFFSRFKNHVKYKMNCIIPSLNLKVFARTLQALAKIGDELFIEATHEKFTLITLNLNKTVCARCHFLDCFFSSYTINDTDSQEPITCKLQMKVILPVFKGQHIEKKLDLLKIEFNSGDDLIFFKMKYKQDDFLMIHKVRLMDPESLTIHIDVESGCNNLCASGSFYNQLLNTFSNSDDEITLEITKKNIVARNYTVGTPVRAKHVRSQVTLNPSEFNVYNILNETTINFSLKPFKTLIHFADSMNIGFNFEKGGQPLAIILKSPTFELNMLVATMNPYSDVRSTMSTNSIPMKITQVQVENGHNLTTEDRDALLNENWDEFEADIDSGSDKSSKILGKKNKPSFNDIIDQIDIGQKDNNKTNEKNKDRTSKKFEFMKNTENEDNVIHNSPESPKSKRTKLLFKRCFEPTFNASMLGEVLAPDSDPE